MWSSNNHQKGMRHDAADGHWWWGRHQSSAGEGGIAGSHGIGNNPPGGEEGELV